MGRLVVPKLKDGHVALAVCPNDILEARWIVVKEGCRTEQMPNKLVPLGFTGDEGSEEAKGHGRALAQMTTEHASLIAGRVAEDDAQSGGWDAWHMPIANCFIDSPPAEENRQGMVGPVRYCRRRDDGQPGAHAPGR